MINYNLSYSRPYGAGTNGSVTSTYYCSDNGAASGNGGCGYHDGSPGAHEIVNDVGTHNRDFEIVSILAELPDTICLGATGQNSVTVTTYPADGGTYTWTSSHPSVQITNGDQKTATIKLLDTSVKNATVKVTFEIGGVSYYDEGVLSTCECSCKPITAGITAGPFQLNFNAPPDAASPDNEGNCAYTSNNASFNMTMTGTIERQVQIPGDATVSFKKNCKTGTLGEVSISWNGDIEIPELEVQGVKIVKLNLTAINLTVATNGNVSGDVTIKATNPVDRDLSMGKGFVMLRQGLNSNITFSFSNTNGFAGTFDFSGLHGIKIDLVKKDNGVDVILADFTGDMTADGTLTGTLAAHVDASYKTNLFRITLKELALGLEMKIPQASFRLTNGNGKVQVSEMRAVTGTIDLGLNFPGNGGCQATVNAADMTAFSMTLSEFTLQADFNADFDLTKVNGSLKAKHEQFDAKIDVSQFEVENGALTKFTAAGAVRYKAFKFTLENANYNNPPSELNITAKVEINTTGAQAMLQVSEFKIAEAGTITVGGISGEFNKAPASFSFNATFGQNKFAGSFNGSFASIGLDGAIDIGTDGDPAFNYAYFAITARGNVPLGQSGLKLTQVGGKAGFNYELIFPGGNGQPNLGSYIIGLNLGVADVANMCEVTGEAIVQFNTYSGNTVVTLNGGIAVLKNNTFFSGSMNVNYRIPQQPIDGRVGAVVKIPSSGFVVTTNNCNVDFNIGNGSWSANGANMSGEMFNGIIQLSGGGINMSGSLSNPTQMSGNLRGRATASFAYGLSVGGYGNTVSGTINLGMNSQINANINQAGLSGSFGVTATGNGTLTFTTWLGSQSFQGSAIANGNIGYNGGTLSLDGTMDVTLPITIPFWGNQISTGMSIAI